MPTIHFQIGCKEKTCWKSLPQRFTQLNTNNKTNWFLRKWRDQWGPFPPSAKDVQILQSNPPTVFFPIHVRSGVIYSASRRATPLFRCQTKRFQRITFWKVRVPAYHPVPSSFFSRLALRYYLFSLLYFSRSSAFSSSRFLAGFL